MPETIHVPVLGNMNRTTVLMGGVAAVGVTGYILYRNSKKKAAAATQTGSGAYAYGYGGLPSGYYGYGYGYGGFSPAGYSGSSYPGAEYGYGAYGYGYYNPYTGQWVGPTGSGVAGPPGPTGPTGKTGPQGKPGTGGVTPNHIITANGKLTLAGTSRANGITELELVAWNPNLMHLYGSGKPIPRGTRVLV